MKLILLLHLQIVLAACESIRFSDYEENHVDTINSLLPVKFEFVHEGHWNERVDRYLFYSVALNTMKSPLVK